MYNTYIVFSKPSAKTRQRFRLLLLLLSFFPGFLVAMWVFYLHHVPASSSNYGILLPRPLQHIDFPDSAQHLWHLCVAIPGNCDDLCRHQLFLLRQMRLGVGPKSKNLGRAVFFDYHMAWPSDKSLYDGVGSVHLSRRSGLNRFSAERGIYLVDPSGFVVMAWPARPNPQLLMKDLDKIMKFY